jgi:hypothetical protein
LQRREKQGDPDQIKRIRQIQNKPAHALNDSREGVALGRRKLFRMASQEGNLKLVQLQDRVVGGSEEAGVADD